MSGGGSWLRTIALTMLLIVLGIALLYAYRSQTPAIPTVPITQAVQDVQAGKVRIVTEIGHKATLDLADNTRESTNLPDNAKTDPIQDAVVAYNNANPTRQVVLKYEEQSATWSVIGSVVLSLLPLVLIGLFIVMIVRGVARPTGRDRYAELERLANLRDRGALSADEFEREKRRLLG